MCYLYMFDDKDEEDINLNKPYICISPELEQYIYQFQKEGKMKDSIMCEQILQSPMLVRAKIKYRGSIVYFYGFERGLSKNKMAIALFYKPDVEGTELEKKLMKILEHCADTYTETICRASKRRV